MRIAALTILVLLAFAAPAAATQATKPKLTVCGVDRTMTRQAFRAGLSVRVGADAPVAAGLVLQVARAEVTIPRLPDVVVASRTLGLGAGLRTVRLVPRRTALGRGPVHARLVVVAFDAGGHLSAKTLELTVR